MEAKAQTQFLLGIESQATQQARAGGWNKEV